MRELKEMLDESGIKGEVFGRPKHFYSIYKKMKNTGKTLDQIYDLSAVRVIVNTTEECYEVLGKIHKKWKPVPGRIKDYIAMPKRNMYQSLHTTVVTDFGQIFEIQIRTFEMHHMAEYGIAAHWRYKEQKGGTDNNFDQRLAWIRDVMDWEGSTGSAKEFVESLKTDLYTNELLVFTPHGKVISLPLEATPIDFAYAIHSEVGNKCVGAKVNSKIVPLNSVLHTGDVVEILTSPNSKGPSWDWLKYVKSGSARAKIRQFFKKEMKEENARTGKAMLDAEAKRRGYSLNDLLTNESFEKLSQKLVFASMDEMFASVGYGAVSVNQIIYKLIDYYKKVVPKAPVLPDKGGPQLRIGRNRARNVGTYDTLCTLLQPRARRRHSRLCFARQGRNSPPQGLPQLKGLRPRPHTARAVGGRYRFGIHSRPEGGSRQLRRHSGVRHFGNFCNAPLAHADSRQTG